MTPHPQHINPGPDATWNPVFVPDTYREKRDSAGNDMSNTIKVSGSPKFMLNKNPGKMDEKMHCDHECVCPEITGIERSRKEPCDMKGTRAHCPHDTRSRPATSPTSYDHDVIGEFCKTARAEAAAQARKEVLDALARKIQQTYVGKYDNESGDIPEVPVDELADIIRSLRTEGGEP